MVADGEATFLRSALRRAAFPARSILSVFSSRSLATLYLRYRVVVFFLAGLIALDAVVYSQQQVWQTYDPDEYVDRVESCRRQRWDLVVIGGSPVSEGVDPSILRGARWRGQPLDQVYNLGLPGGTTTDFWHAVRHGIAAPPRLLIYGITASDLNDSRLEPHGARIVHFGDLCVWARERPSTAEWIGRHYLEEHLAEVWKLWRHRNGIRLWTADRAERCWPGLCPAAAAEARSGLYYSAGLNRGDGYAPRLEFETKQLDQIKAAGGLNQPFPFLKDYRIGQHLAYLHRLLDWAGHRGVTVVLVDMPVSADLEHKYTAEFSQYRATLADIEQQRGVRLLRASRKAVGLGDADFADLIHLNAAGRARFCEWLKKELTAENAESTEKRAD